MSSIPGSDAHDDDEQRSWLCSLLMYFLIPTAQDRNWENGLRNTFSQLPFPFIIRFTEILNCIDLVTDM